MLDGSDGHVPPRLDCPRCGQPLAMGATSAEWMCASGHRVTVAIEETLIEELDADTAGATGAAPAVGIVHVANGDSTADTLREAGLPGVVINWADALTDGPVPDGAVPERRRREMRAAFWGATGLVSDSAARAIADAWDRDLRSYDPDDEIVIWCEHDLYDQLLLLHHLHFLATAAARPRASSLICVDRFPGVERFIGLGQLSAPQLASLFPRRRSLDDADLALGARGWTAFTSDDPRAIERLLDDDTRALPFLAAALRRLLEEYPSTRDGLPRTERSLLALVADGPRTFHSVFAEWQRGEAAPFYGDWSLWTRIAALARGPAPLVTIDGRAGSDAPRAAGPRPLGEARIAVTADGLRVLAGEADWLALDPFDRWIGGVHLVGPRTWRWDAPRGRIVAPASH